MVKFIKKSWARSGTPGQRIYHRTMLTIGLISLSLLFLLFLCQLFTSIKFAVFVVVCILFSGFVYLLCEAIGA